MNSYIIHYTGSQNYDAEKAHQPKKSLSSVGLIFMVFFAVSGGAFGLEDGLGKGYPLIFLITLLVVPWIWCLPNALMSAELTSAMPENGGYLLWIDKSFGRFWAVQAGWWNVWYGILNNALLPIMFVDYLANFSGAEVIERHWYLPFVIRVAFIIFCLLLNIFGVQVVEKATIVFGIIVLAPFYVMFAMGAKEIDPHDWTILPPSISGVNWGVFISVVLWNTSGWDNMSLLSGEMNPATSKKKYIKLLIIVIILVITNYLMSFLVGMSVAKPYDLWTEGYFLKVAETVGGLGLQIMMLAGALTTSLSAFILNTCFGAQSISSMAEPQMIDIPCFTWKSRYNTPWISILFFTLPSLAVMLLPEFSVVLQLSQTLAVMRVLLEQIALIVLRFTHPKMERPFKIGLNNTLLILAFTPAILICLIFFYFAFTESLFNVICTGGVVLLGFSFYFVRWAFGLSKRDEKDEEERKGLLN
jgi:amino acid transporter